MLKTENQTKVYIHFEDHWKHSSHKTKRRQPPTQTHPPTHTHTNKKHKWRLCLCSNNVETIGGQQNKVMRPLIYKLDYIWKL